LCEQPQLDMQYISSLDVCLVYIDFYEIYMFLNISFGELLLRRNLVCYFEQQLIIMLFYDEVFYMQKWKA